MRIVRIDRWKSMLYFLFEMDFCSVPTGRVSTQRHFKQNGQDPDSQSPSKRWIQKILRTLRAPRLNQFFKS